jgi:uncharacterized membrane protein SpoIIM required for sporulation
MTSYRITLALYLIFGYFIGLAVHGFWNFLAVQDSLLFLLILPFGLFELMFFISMVLGAFYLATRRYRKKLKVHRNV